MNRYGEQAMEHWRQNRPQAYRELEDPQEYFTDLGTQIEQEVEARARQLAGTEPDGEGYLQRLGRLNTARLEAEGAVLRERALLEEEPEQD
ncbi:hypothetical protein ABZ896_10180 [Streptomyces sp. NPDC047072]|uniref:hypothetical protein n=1 Tax=Streptomyces sp. NPDC047072 TaxID=3154809 RepID=UPI0033F70349